MFLLDTNTISELVRRRPHPNVLLRFGATPDRELFTSVICVEEIRFGCRVVPDGDSKWRTILARVFSRVTVLDLTYAAALRAGELRAEWKQAGTPVGYEDGLIAATTMETGLILETRNVRHFDHIGHLRFENWFEDLQADGHRP